MEKESEQKGTEESPRFFTGRRGVMVLLVVGALFAVSVYFWYVSVTNREQRAQNILTENEVLKEEFDRFEMLRDATSREYNRCQEFISQREGDFGSFEYCKKFIEWANTQKSAF